MDKDTLFSSFGKWVTPLNSVKFTQRIEEMKQDKYTKKLTTKAYLLLFLHAQLQQREGLRAIADDALLDDFQRELGLTSISASQLSRKHRQVKPELLAEIFLDLVNQIRQMSTNSSSQVSGLKIVDSTTISLNLKKYQWATFRKTKSGIKVHLRLVFVNEDTVYPEKMVMTLAGNNDRTQMEQLIDETDAMYVFDRGYVDYEKFDYYCDKGLFFASRLKKNAYVRFLESFSVPSNSSILSDSMVVIGTPQKRTENVFRLIETFDSDGNRIRIITNRFDLDPEELGDIYRSRWAIELFFKWIKQRLTLKHLYGTSPEAVENQVYLALISYCLLILIQLEMKSKHSLTQIYRWLCVFLWKPSTVWVERIQRE